MYKGAFFLLGALFCLVSCSEQYNISGDSSVSTLDGRMLYLKAVTNSNGMLNLDSCEVVHGKFSFMGMVDSTCMGELCMDNQSVMPIVIEHGNISIRINDMEQRAFGGSLNDRLYRFLDAKNQLEGEIYNLHNQEARLILAGNDPLLVQERLSGRQDQLYDKIEKLETDFIIKNNDNILGTTYFMMICNQYPYPLMTKQIQQILKKSPSKFRNKPYVRDYVQAAEYNMRFLRNELQD